MYVHDPNGPVVQGRATSPAVINGQDTTLEWRDQETLVIGGTDIRIIDIVVPAADGMQTFYCG